MTHIGTEIGTFIERGAYFNLLLERVAWCLLKIRVLIDLKRYRCDVKRILNSFLGGHLWGQGPGAPNSTSRLKHGGAGHGGTGGRGSCGGLKNCISRKGLPYGSMLHPNAFGSGGDGAAAGGKGGGIISIVTSDTLQVRN